MSITRVGGFEHIHQHSHISLLDGYAFPAELAERGKKINQQFLCITDHGAMGAIPEQIRCCDKYKLNPIFGCELYLNSNQPELKEGETTGEYAKELNEKNKKKLRKSNHLLALAYTNEGYSNLVRLSSMAWISGFYYKPRINYEMLNKYKSGIIFTSCCYSSEIGSAYDRSEDEAYSMVEKYIEMLGKDNFYLTIMLNDFKKQKAYNVFIQKACQRYGLKPVLENDVHYCNKEDSKYQRYMIMIQTKKTLAEIAEVIAKAEADGEQADVFELQDSNLWMKSESELNSFYEEKFADTIDPDFFAEAKLNTVRICQQAKGVTFDRSIKLPKIENANDKLKEAIMIGFKKRGLPQTREYLDRIKEEYQLICHKEFSSYFLIQKMMTDEARRWWGEKTNSSGDDAVGPARGSAAGSLVSYCLRITDVNPIKFDLLFSRFLSPARGGKTMKLRFNSEPI